MPPFLCQGTTSKLCVGLLKEQTYGTRQLRERPSGWRAQRLWVQWTSYPIRPGLPLVLAFLTRTYHIVGIEFSPNGEHIAMAVRNHSVFVLDSRNGDQLTTMEVSIPSRWSAITPSDQPIRRGRSKNTVDHSFPRLQLSCNWWI